MADMQTPSFHIVGIGGSAGGLEAFCQFFTHVPLDTGLAYVVVSHLDPTHKTMLVELLQRTTKIHVAEITDGMLVQPNKIYVIPQNADLGLRFGRFHLLEPKQQHGLRLPIDFFFRQLAAECQEQAIGIVLSGMGSDGTQGLRAIKQNAGLTMAQDPASAKFDAMPRSAINARLTDIVARADELPSRMQQYLTNKPVFPEEVSNVNVEMDRALLPILKQLELRTGNDFSNYKRTTILRRIERRMGIHHFDELSRYINFLQEHPQELDLLHKELLIGVTSFFRDPGLFDYLRESALPALMSAHPDDRPVRIWVPACSTGEEAYSLAMTIQETLDEVQLKHSPRVQIYATDIDPDAIAHARRKTFTLSIEADVNTHRLKRFFLLDGETYRISKVLRDNVIFATHNLLADPPFTKLDILCCRNFFIYVNAEMQKKLLSLFHFALNPGGLLILGSAESTGDNKHLFAPLAKKWKIFKRQETTQRPSVVMRPRPLPPPLALPRLSEPLQDAPLDITYAAQRALLDSYAPPSVVITPAGDIVYVNGHVGMFLEPSSGKVNQNVFAMAREGLRDELGTSVRRVRNEQAAVTVDGLRVKSNGDFTTIKLTVRPLTFETATLPSLLLVIFEAVAAPPTSRRNIAVQAGEKTVDHKFEEQLQRAHELLQNAVVEKDLVQEKLRSLNEESQSNIEELQSTNEELTTSQEELQSLNEEMQSVNAELQGKLDELSETNDDMANLLNGIEIAVIFLDAKLCLKRFTPQAVRIVNLIATDLGRPLAHLVTKLKYDHLVDDARQVLDTLVPKAIQVQAHDEHWYRVRVIPYRTIENKIDGVVCTFTDITATKQSETILQQVRWFADTIISSIREPLLILDGELRIVKASAAFYETFQTTPAKTEGQLIYKIDDGEWDIPALRRLLETVLPGETTFQDFRLEHEFPRIGLKRLLLNARRVDHSDERAGLILLAFENEPTC